MKAVRVDKLFQLPKEGNPIFCLASKLSKKSSKMLQKQNKTTTKNKNAPLPPCFSVHQRCEIYKVSRPTKRARFETGHGKT